MDRERIFEVICKHLRRNVDGMEDAEIKPDGCMEDYGAGSLDMIEVVSCASRELGIQVPRTKLVNARNLNELVDIFVGAAGKVEV